MNTALSIGRIVWVEMADSNGIIKLRPAVIVSPREENAIADSPIHVVAITIRVPNPLPDDHVMLPWNPQGHPRTKLNRKCAAVVSWSASILENEVQELAGVVLLEILHKVASQTPPTTAGE